MNDALPIDYKQRPFRSAIAWAIRAIKLRHFPLRLEIGKEREMQPAIAGERGMALCSINRNAHNLCSQVLKHPVHLGGTLHRRYPADTLEVVNALRSPAPCLWRFRPFAQRARRSYPHTTRRLRQFCQTVRADQ